MTTVLLILKIILAILCVAVIAVVLMQDSNEDGLSSVITGGGSDSFYGKNKKATLKAKLSKWTIILCIVFAVIVLVTDIIISKM